MMKKEESVNGSYGKSRSNKKKELNERAKNSIGHYFSKEKNQYYMDEVDHLYSSYQEEQRRLKEFKQR